MTASTGWSEKLLRRHLVPLRDALTITYALTHLDRIGQTGLSERGGVPGIWGHSYVSTYNGWAGTVPDARVRMEGGIATSYYVVRSLCALARTFPEALPQSVVSETYEFFLSRCNSSGSFGIRRPGTRGGEEIDDNLRHTCFGAMTVVDLGNATGFLPPDLEQKMTKVVGQVFRPRSQDDLLTLWFKESWPVGGLAAYIAARDSILASRFSAGVEVSARRAWSSSRRYLLDVLAGLRSRQVECTKAHLGLEGDHLTEHWPFWHPIFDKKVLRLHSTLGCLALVGNAIAERPVGRARIREVVSSLASETRHNGFPAFAATSPPSIAAAFAMLEVVLGPWQQGDAPDSEALLDNTLGFIASNWREAGVYREYWSEFTAQSLALEPLARAVDLQQVVARGNEVIRRLKGRGGQTKRNSGKSLGKLLKVLESVVPMALGTE